MRRSLTDEQALWALGQYRAGTMTQTQIAEKLGATLSRINQLVNGKTYKHLHGTAGQRVTDGGVLYGLTETPERRRFREALVWSQIARRGPDKCWEWNGTTRNGYGWAPSGANLVGSPSAHVVAYTLARGLREAPANLLLRHLCDNKPCCNPAHLRPGNLAENNRDQARARREGRMDGPTVPRVVDDPEVPAPAGWSIPEEIDLPFLEREARIAEFWAQVARRGPDECWPWIGKPRNRFGYGFMRFDGQNTPPAHRIAYVIEHGLTLADIRGKQLNHQCATGDHRNDCANPAHVKIGTQAENMADKKLHGTMPLGEKHHMGQRYPDELIRSARIRYHRPEGMQPTITELAVEACVAIGVMSRWLKGEFRREAGGPVGPDPECPQCSKKPV
ncbi:HNH endonuclease [Kitasatospora sp. A2-31]|uniref:HNH endonuclease n=1 Tax=Kitasatospora sp. A2-31 TaxID=2916414 RepID=UPI001EEBABA3|nr:HNH endonuclease [Kitasatospora sp. A2-31]MCG6495678.1 HNH endonuclease [Kitasatospora sp. A2-31]